MRLYPTFFKLFFASMDPEKAHHIGLWGIQTLKNTGITRALKHYLQPHPDLQTTAMGLTFPSPFGIAAGFDKGGKAIPALAALGFGHIEIGTVTAQAQPGNPQPRLFRLIEDKAVINRMGFNNDGAAAVGPRVAAARADLETEHLAPQADYLAVNVSSPNTPGLRSLQSIEALRPLLQSVREEADRVSPHRHIPLTVKIAPDLADEDIIAVAQLAEELQLDGIIATNTTIARDGLGLRSPKTKITTIGAGGLSGEPLKTRSLEVLRLLKQELGDTITIISVGGVTTARDVQDRLNAGADLVQGYTAFLYEGPLWAAHINRGLLKLRRKNS